MKNLFRRQAFPLLLFIVASSTFSLHTQSFEALSESDLDGVSAESGNEILNIFGAPSAGLVSDGIINENRSSSLGATLTVSDLIRGELNPDDITEEEISTDLAIKQLRFLEDRAFDVENFHDPIPHFDEHDIIEEIEAQTIVVSTDISPRENGPIGETIYTEGRHHVSVPIIEPNFVHAIHDVHYDLIKLDNLVIGGGNTSIGSIYLSDFTSYSSHKTFVHD